MRRQLVARLARLARQQADEARLGLAATVRTIGEAEAAAARIETAWREEWSAGCSDARLFDSVAAFASRARAAQKRIAEQVRMLEDERLNRESALREQLALARSYECVLERLTSQERQEEERRRQAEIDERAALEPVRSATFR